MYIYVFAKEMSDSKRECSRKPRGNYNVINKYKKKKKPKKKYIYIKKYLKEKKTLCLLDLFVVSLNSSVANSAFFRQI